MKGKFYSQNVTSHLEQKAKAFYLITILDLPFVMVIIEITMHNFMLYKLIAHIVSVGFHLIPFWYFPKLILKQKNSKHYIGEYYCKFTGLNKILYLYRNEILRIDKLSALKTMTNRCSFLEKPNNRIVFKDSKMNDLGIFSDEGMQFEI